MKRLVTLIAFLAIGMMAFASVPKQHRITFDHPYVIENTVLEPGVYHVAINGEQATIIRNHQTVASDLKVETAPKKFRQSAVVSRTSGDKRELVAIQVGGTHYKVVVQ